jgi:hypothetical protein
MPLIIQEGAADRLIDLTALALRTGTYPGLIAKLAYLATYGDKGDGEHQVHLLGGDGGDSRPGYSIGLLWMWRQRPSDPWGSFMHGGLVYHESHASPDRAWGVHT